MASEPRLSVQTSIVLAGCIVALGLYFGLRGREPAPPTPSTGSAATATLAGVGSPPPEARTTSPSPAPSAAVTTAASTTALPRSGPDKDAAVLAVRKSLEKRHDELVKKCVAPAFAKQPDPPRLKLTFNMTFGPDGKQLSRGVAEDRETHREGVVNCVTDALPPFEIPAQGASVFIEVPWVVTRP